MPHARPAASSLQGVDLRALAGALFRRGTFGLTSHLYQISLRTPHRPGARFSSLQRLSPTCFPWRLQPCCKRQPHLRGICNHVANVNRVSEAFATMLQTSTASPRHLQQCCKRQPRLHGICNSLANVNRVSTAFATVLQTSTASPRHLQPCCKQCRKSDHSSLNI